MDKFIDVSIRFLYTQEMKQMNLQNVGNHIHVWELSGNV